MSTTKQPQNLGFEDAFDQVKPDQWTVPEKSISNDHEVGTTDLKQVAEATGFVSRQIQTLKKPTAQINFRAKVSTLADFRALCGAQEPSWPYGYGLERAVAALKRELQQDPVRNTKQ